MSSNHIGRCALCGKETELTYEHIPPRKAFNWFPAKTVNGEDYLKSNEEGRMPWDFSSLPYNNVQRGTGYYSLCKQCNSNTGTWFGDDYVNFVYGFHNFIVKLQPKSGMRIHVKEAVFRPLPVMKQILSMFCSLNHNSIDTPGIKMLRNFVLDKATNEFPKENFRLGMYLLASGIRRHVKFVVLGRVELSGFKYDVLSEIVTYPLGFILYLNPDQNLKMPCTDVTFFSDYKYDEECMINFDLPVCECNIMYPGDFRSKAEIFQCAKDSRIWNEQHEE